MFGFGLPELCIVAVILLVVAGPSKLPQFGQALGSSIRGFKKAMNGEDVVQINEKNEKKEG
ncbi:twin-arginine translocase TatA/TatE family subunit [Geomonas sp. Red69]|uniref:Sec-independent protein translocase protein TatA n=1 Tax=Geomonas diazotrophica TaxID=2843197 RepID=A0ABX8JMY3_9BACT|nr:MULTISPECIES: twin-arginine translocase TatA/TatE family subunit [Geomonas]MBU5636660.1 twin-arginine translocase TatA/TatE family subunit [Geomonas diazotrophica]QWV98521.1 twin-arginine translocase TatA/TatE family subunit [Geomonas nitrogeniifigens]QXE87704.1 twin-arginine translocase TatA/TatE family subunit [Geomonas nitrogeniifigens]